jgi:hypothetical protein
MTVKTVDNGIALLILFDTTMGCVKPSVSSEVSSRRFSGGATLLGL